ncbi:hypothetical protein LJC52_04320 [Bacteroidales bacterium OttesenSCG-928-A17]|nr:hypothetical protein [Bacteroidales bacterium OttesenSCG-928-A17]
MKKINKIPTILALCFLVLISVSCNDNDDWTPGQEVVPNNPGVYFDMANEAIGNVAPGEQYLDIAISRINTNGSLTVPITVLWGSEGLTFPDQSVTFAAGEETAYYRIGFDPDVVEYENPYPFGLEIEHFYTDPYDESIPGTVTYSGKLNRGEPWVFVAEMTCTFEARSGTAKFDEFKQNLYKKVRTGKYKIENWCLNNTGEWYGDLLFTVDEDKKIHPDESIGYHGEPGRWYFYLPWADSDASSWQINGNLPTSTGVYMTYFYLYKVGSSDSAYAMDFDEEAKTAKMGGYSRYSKSTFSSGRFWIHYAW